MPVRRLTPQEVQSWLGNGIILPGPRQKPSSPSKVPAPGVVHVPDDLEQAAFMAFEEAIQGLATESKPAEVPDDLNRVETEQDGVRAGALRVLKARHQSRSFQAQSRAPQNSKHQATGKGDISEKVLKCCVEDLENQLQEWLGFDVPAQGTQDHGVWLMKRSLIDQVKTIEDVYALCDGGDFSLPSVLEER